MGVCMHTIFIMSTYDIVPINFTVSTESSQLGCSISTFIICHWTSSGEIACFPNQSRFKGNLLTIEAENSEKQVPHRATSKPQIYEALIQLLSTSEQWVLDPIGGAGKLLDFVLKGI